MRVYKNRYCECGCGKRIKVSTNINSIARRKRYGIPKYIWGHNDSGGPQKQLKGEDSPFWKGGMSLDRSNSKQRGKGFVPLNRKTKINNECHHLRDNTTVIFEPKKLHLKSFHGFGCTKEQRIESDQIAINWYLSNLK